MSSNRQFRRQQQKSIPIFLNLIDAWKVRSINGFEKYLFPNTEISVNNAIVSTKSTQKLKLITKIDPARFIYPRDAMGNMLTPLFNRKTSIFTPFYLPKYDFTKTRSPVWTIKNVHQSKRVIHHVGPMTYNSVNDKSQLPCKSGWTQIGRRAFNIPLALTVPFYDTRKYKQVGEPCSKHAVIIGRRTTRKDIKTKRIPNVIERKSNVSIKYTCDIRDHESIEKRSGSIDKILSSTKNLYRKSNNLTASDDHVVEVETIDLPSLELSMKTEPKMIIREEETTVSRDDQTLTNDQNQHDSTIQLKVLPSEEFETLLNQSTDGARNQ